MQAGQSSKKRSPQNGLAVNAPEASGREFQSQGVIEMLKNRLLDQFIAGRTELKKEEMNTEHALTC